VRPTSDQAPLRELGVLCSVQELGDGSGLKGLLQGVAVVYHIAAAYRVEHTDPGEFRRVNVDATRTLLEAARAAAVERFVHCSTVGVQGHIADAPATEEYRFAPGDHYQQSKLEGELIARRFGEAGLPVTVVRPVGIYGPGDRRFLKLFRAIDRRRFVMIGSGRTLYHMTYIDDLVDGILLAGTRPEAVGEVFTIGGRCFSTLRELVNLIADVLGRPHPRLRVPLRPVMLAAVLCERTCRWLNVPPPLYPRRVEFFVHDRAFDIGKARRLLCYEPRVDLKAGLARTADWYRANGWL
jgi:nucleoside-diphosphate-sugar epimerase